MTLYLLFEDLEAGRISMTTRLPVSRVAASRSPSKLYLKPGQSIAVKDAIYALITKSANDVATVVAEGLSKTEREFGKRMTRKARALGMSRTTFRNASGLPHSKQRTTARDMARLAIAVRRDFPQFFGFFGTKSFRWKGQRFGNHNKLLANYAGTDGIKTGYIDASGFNLVATVERAGVRLIGVVFGGRSGRTRDAHMVEILDKSFKRVKPADIRTQLASAGNGKVTALPKTLPVPPPVPARCRWRRRLGACEAAASTSRWPVNRPISTARRQRRMSEWPARRASGACRSAASPSAPTRTGPPHRRAAPPTACCPRPRHGLRW